MASQPKVEKTKKRRGRPPRTKPLGPPITSGMDEVPELDLSAAFDFLGATHVRTPPPQEPKRDKIVEPTGYAPSRENDETGTSDGLPWMGSPN